MESRVTVHATLEEMERLFDDTKGGFLVKYYERTEHHQNYDTFKVIVRHGEDIGRQDGDSVRFFVFLDCPMALWRDLSLQLHKIYDTVYSARKTADKYSDCFLH